MSLLTYAASPRGRTLTPPRESGTDPARGRTIEILEPGTQTTVQDLRGRRGFWGVGVPPSGAFDDYACALANLAVGNDPGAAAMEAVLTGPRVLFRDRALVAVTGACQSARLAGRRLRAGVPVTALPGDVLNFGPCGPAGLRGYLAVRGGFAVSRVLGSRATFLLGRFGGASGRALTSGDVLSLGREENCGSPADCGPFVPQLTDTWRLRVIPGPHGAPEYFADDALADLFAAEWSVDHRSDRTGIRLAGPPVRFARADGGEAGLHPCNIHDSAYPIGGIMVSGDTPVIVGPDGPSLGGFVVPAAVTRADLWKLGQLRPGDRVRLEPVTPMQAAAALAERTAALADLGRVVERAGEPVTASVATHERPEALARIPATAQRPELTVRHSGDHHLLVEAGPPRLDLTVRARIHLLARELRLRNPPSITETVEGVRSLLLGFDAGSQSAEQLAAEVARAWVAVPDPRGIRLDVREVTLPICFDDPDAHEAMRRYQRGVRPDAPWCPDNVEFIRRVNGLATREEVFEIVRTASYLVVGLGDVYLGAPVAVPLDPAHRLVTTKYDPPRTWTPENAVGIGGAYLCVYGMEGPGGYQLVGRTVPVWRKPPADDPGKRHPDPWLLRTFDVLRFEPVSHDELTTLRAEVAEGSRELTMRQTTLDLGALPAPDAPMSHEAQEFTERRVAAFAQERQRWAERGARK
ncbi:MAG TPA: 5-oxoprolinase/urea amidolyase family protein [Actinocrinis sp.]|nr:5-oxoprolinase/urea amidolyase family protein [Actinocrinis sp.]